MWKQKALILSPAILFLAACGGPDHQAINTYFKAVKNGDNAAMAAVSTVEFPETVQSWTVVEMGPESVSPFPLKELNRVLREARMDLEYIAEKDYTFLSDNQNLYKRYKAEIEKNPDAELEGELADFHQEFRDIRQKGEDAEKAVEKANREFEREKLMAGISLMGATVTDDLDGEVVTKEAVVNVMTSSGQKTYRIKLRNYNLVNQQNMANLRSRWIISDVEEGDS
jgi:cellobiose-specific phosphotransferase system component IIB